MIFMTPSAETLTTVQTRMPKYLFDLFLAGMCTTAGMMAAYKIYQICASPSNRREVKELTARLLKRTAEKFE
jgi:hypothetical protein